MEFSKKTKINPLLIVTNFKIEFLSTLSCGFSLKLGRIIINDHTFFDFLNDYKNIYDLSANASKNIKTYDL